MAAANLDRRVLWQAPWKVEESNTVANVEMHLNSETKLEQWSLVSFFFLNNKVLTSFSQI